MLKQLIALFASQSLQNRESLSDAQSGQSKKLARASQSLQNRESLSDENRVSMKGETFTSQSLLNREVIPTLRGLFLI